MNEDRKCCDMDRNVGLVLEMCMSKVHTLGSGSDGKPDH